MTNDTVHVTGTTLAERTDRTAQLKEDILRSKLRQQHYLEFYILGVGALVSALLCSFLLLLWGVII